jgi:hypothetical protein
VQEHLLLHTPTQADKQGYAHDEEQAWCGLNKRKNKGNHLNVLALAALERIDSPFVLELGNANEDGSEVEAGDKEEHPEIKGSVPRHALLAQIRDLGGCVMKAIEAQRLQEFLQSILPPL